MFQQPNTTLWACVCVCMCVSICECVCVSHRLRVFQLSPDGLVSSIWPLTGFRCRCVLGAWVPQSVSMDMWLSGNIHHSWKADPDYPNASCPLLLKFMHVALCAGHIPPSSAPRKLRGSYLLLWKHRQTQRSDKRVRVIPNVTAVRHKPSQRGNDTPGSRRGWRRALWTLVGADLVTLTNVEATQETRASSKNM